MKLIAKHPGVESVEPGERSGVIDYNWVVELKDGWTFRYGRMAGCCTGHFQSYNDFKFAEPYKKN